MAYDTENVWTENNVAPIAGDRRSTDSSMASSSARLALGLEVSSRTCGPERERAR